VCEIGCGIGNITQFVLNCKAVVGIDRWRASYEQAKQRFRDHLECEVRPGAAVGFRVMMCRRMVDTVVCL